MILEFAILNVRAGEGEAFEAAFTQAQRTSRPCRATFRTSCGVAWKRLLHHFYEPFPKVEHYEPVCAGQAFAPADAAG